MSTVPSNYPTLADAVLEKRLYSPIYSTQEKMAEYLGISLNEYKKIEYGIFLKRVSSWRSAAGWNWSRWITGAKYCRKAVSTRKNGRMKQESNR